MDPIEQYTVNFLGNVREETLNGRKYLVAPVSLIVEGVLNGSRGPLYYPKDTISRSVSSWNNIPLTLKHPVGKSARSPEVLAEQGIGYLFNSKDDGKLQAEAWFDIEITNSRDATLIADVKNGMPVEVSTGLFSETKEGQGIFNSKEYSGTVVNITPDHLAVLRDETGACSLEDGCGINNSLFDESFVSKLKTLVTNLGRKNPPNTDPKTEDDSMALNAVVKKEMVDNLIANCDCYKESDRETLNKMDDSELVSKSLQAQTERELSLKKQSNETIQNALKPIPIDDDHQMVFNSEKGEWEKKAVQKETPTENSSKPMTEEEWLAAAPEGIRAVFNHSKQSIENERKAKVERLLKTFPKERREEERKLVENKSSEELDFALRLREDIVQLEDDGASYEGAMGFSAVHNSDNEDLDFDDSDTIPVLNYEDDYDADFGDDED